MGLQGVPVDDYMIWAKPLNEYGTRAVVLLNTSQEARDITVRFEDIDLRGTERMKLRVTHGYDGSNLDRADWADAKVACE